MLISLYDGFRYGLCLLVLFANFCLYILILAALRRWKPRRVLSGAAPLAPELLPRFHLIVPLYNEADHIAAKLRNLEELDYPRDKITITLVDGGSTDGTLMAVQEFVKTASPSFRLLNARQRGKIPQLNEALADGASADYIAISDADSKVSPPSALRELAETFRANPDVGLIGAWTIPDDPEAPRAELAYWDKENRLRYLESLTYSASIILAPFYSFRSDLIERYPDDCIADDVYASWACHLSEQRVLYHHQIEARECRQPRTLRDLFVHKSRKANAYTIELLRVLYLLPTMGKRLKLIYLYKIFQFFYLPWIPIVFAGEVLLQHLRGNDQLLAISAAAFLLGLGVTSASLRPPPNRTRGGIRLTSILPTIQVLLLLNTVLIWNFFRFPFRRQDSSYRRLPSRIGDGVGARRAA